MGNEWAWRHSGHQPAHILILNSKNEIQLAKCTRLRPTYIRGVVKYLPPCLLDRLLAQKSRALAAIFSKNEIQLAKCTRLLRPIYVQVVVKYLPICLLDRLLAIRILYRF